MQITAPISKGSSGGALLNDGGEIIGVTFAGVEDGQNINFAIPSNEIMDVYENKSFVYRIAVQDFIKSRKSDPEVLQRLRETVA